MTTPLDDCSMREPVYANSNTAMLAAAYVPWQVPGKMYSICDGLERGTIYPELDQPYLCPHVCDKTPVKEGCNCG